MGTIYRQGGKVFLDKDADNRFHECPKFCDVFRPRMMLFEAIENFTVRDVTLQDAAFWTLQHCGTQPGCKAEYQRRHAEIWPEMVEVLKEAGICNYSIFYCNDELFGYYECEKGVAYAEKVQSESPVVDRWNEYMKDILELEMDPVTGAQPKLEQVFRLD